MTLVYVPAGEFKMGSTDGDDDEQPVHTVALDAFWLDQTEVTNAQYAAFLNAQGNSEEGGVTWLDVEDSDCLIEQRGSRYQPLAGYETHPVIEVSWYGAAAYCEWVGGRLPTEAEWEYAARGPKNLVYPWGNAFECAKGNFDDETVQDSYVVPGGAGCDGYAMTSPVGSFPEGRSWVHVYDLSGNVWEWVADWYWADYYVQSLRENPQGPTSGDYRVLRGGSWNLYERNVCGTNRHRNAPTDTYGSRGFRCAASMAPGE
jgi:serine/threonine-protein kinase